MRLMVRGRRVVARMPRLVKTGMIVALLAVFTLGSGSVIGAGRFGVPTAHAAASCTAPTPDATEALIPDLTQPNLPGVPTTTPMHGDAWADLAVYYDSSGNYCYMTVTAGANLGPGYSHGGYVWGGLYDCNGNYQTGTNVKFMSGGGAPWNQFITVTSSGVSPACGYVLVEVWYYDNYHNKVLMWAYSSEVQIPGIYSV
jgi:hypothetical protein